MVIRPLFLLLCACLLPSLHGATPDGEVVREAWTDAATFQATEAHRLFEQAKARPGVDRREAALGAAVTLLDVQPKTVGNVERARAQLQELIQADPADEAGLQARYFLARIVQIHQAAPDLGRAEEMYRALFHDRPDSVIGQLALEKAALLCLYATAPAADRPARFAALEQLGAALTDPVIASNFHYLLGQAALRFHLSPRQAFEHLQWADRLGIVGDDARSTNLIRLGQLGLQLGKKDAAVGYWGLFVRQFPRDPRNYVIRQKLAALAGPGAPAS